MADTFARQRQLIGSTADWAANNIVLGSGEIGVERVSASDVRIKIGDGSATWSSLPYASASSTSINTATQAALDAKVAKSGGTMTGLLVLSGDATAPLGAATKQQLDAMNSALSASVAGKLDKAGGTLTGGLTLQADPVQPLQPATKQYTDAADALKVSKSGDTMTGALVLPADPVNPLEASTKRYVDSGSYQTAIGGTPAYAGKVVRLNSLGVLDSSIVPVAASYLGTIDLTQPYALSGTFLSGNYYTVISSGPINATWATKLNGSPTSCSAGQFLIFNTNGGRFDLVGESVNAAALSSKLDKSGGTMTGPLVLAANPTNALEAAPKQYVDTMVPKAGGTMTGFLTLSADPTSPLHAATKQYIDNKVVGLTSFVNKSGDTMTGALTLSGNATAALQAVPKQQLDAVDTAVRAAFAAADTAITTAYQNADSNRVNKAGDAMTGLLTLSGDPTSALHAVTKQYVDAADANVAKVNVANTFTQKQTFSAGVDSLYISSGTPISASHGGAFTLAKPATTTLSGNVVIDAFSSHLRILENGGAFRGVYLDLAAQLAGASSRILTTVDVPVKITVGVGPHANPGVGDLWVDTN